MPNKSNSLPNENFIDVDAIEEEPSVTFELTTVIVGVNQVKIECKYGDKKYIIANHFAQEQDAFNIKELIPDLNLDLAVTKDGSIIINGGDPKVNLKLKTNASIMNTSPFSCNTLEAKANSVLLYHDITVNNDCYVDYNEHLGIRGKLKVARTLGCKGLPGSVITNYGGIFAHRARFNDVNQLSAKLINHGLIVTKQELELGSKSLYNYGAVLAAKLLSFGKSLFNTGTIFTDQGISLNYSDSLNNLATGMIASNNKIHLRRYNEHDFIDLDELPPTISLFNQGKVITLDKLVLSTLSKHAEIIANDTGGLLKAADIGVIGIQFVNEGKIIGEQQIKVRLSANKGHWYNKSQGEVATKHLDCIVEQITNDGKIAAQQEITSLLQNLRNLYQGEISGNTISLIALEKIINDGIIKANEELSIYCNITENSTYGQLLGNKVLLSCQQIENQGDIISQKSCEIITALLDNLANGKIISSEELSLAIENQLYNEGYLFAGQGKIKAGKKLINGAYGTISARETIDLTTSTVINEGNIDAPQINLTAINKFNQRSTGRILANLLQIKGHALAFSGETLAKITAILEASKELVVSKGAQIAGNNQVLVSSSVLVNAGNITSQNSLVVDVACSMQQSNDGQMVAPKLDIKATEIANAGIISANNNLSLSANTLNNLYNAIIESSSQLTIDAAYLANAGIIEAYGQLQLKILYCLDNLANGRINSLQDLIIEAGSILKNAGFINADTRALITLSDILSNGETGIITAKQFDLKGGWKLENYGKILAESELLLDIRTTINNYQSGTISSQAALKSISSNLNNRGQVTANHLELSLQNILNNYQTGNIEASHMLNLVGAKLMLNAGEITSEHDLNATAIEVLENLKSGKITAQASLQLIGELLVENNGLVNANKLKLAASQLLLNGELHSKQLIAQGKVIAGDGIIDGGAIDLTADLVRIDGKLIASSLSIEAKNYLQLLKNGSITCTEASKLITQAGFINLGKILNYNKLAIIAKDVFHDATASVAAEGEIYIKAINAYLDGDIKASQNLFLLVANEFEYNTVKLTANGELHLTLKDGSQVKQNINTAGDLKIEFLTNTGVWYNEQQLVAGGELTLDIPGVIFVNGKSSAGAMLRANKNINLYGQGLDTGCGKIQADKLNTHTTSDINLNKDSNIAVNSVSLHTDAGKIEQQTELKLTGDAELLATQCEPIIYSIADATGAVKQFKPNLVTNADSADALATIYQLAGTKEVGWAARIKASQQLKEHINDPVVHQLVTEEVTAVLLSAKDLSALATIGLDLTTEEITLLGYYKLVNGSSKITASDQELLEEELQELVESKLLTYIESSIEKSNFWFGLAAGSSGVMGAIGHINNINFNVFTDTTDENPQKANITKLCTNNTLPDAPIHNIYVKAAQQGHWQFALLTEVIANQTSVNSTITVEQSIKAKTVKVMADGTITVTSQIEAEANNLIESLCADVEIKSLKARSGNHENFDDYILSQARVAAGKLLSIKGINIILQKAETASGEAGTHVEALSNILDISVDLLSQRIQHFYDKRKSGYSRDNYLRQHPSLHQSKGNFNSFAGNSSSYYAPTIEAEEATIASTNETTLFADVHDSHEHHEDIRTKKRRLYGGSKKTHRRASAVRATSHGTRFKVKKLKVSGSNVELRNVHSSAESNLFAAPNGKVSILQGVNKIAATNSFTSSEPLWQRQSSKQENHTTYSASTFTGTIEIAAKTAEIEVVCGQVLSFLNQITLKPEDTVYKILYEHHEVHAEAKEGPGAALIALVALATTIATHGTASGWATSLLNGATSGFTHTAITAGFQSIMAQAASAIVANNGDLDKALKDLCQKDTLKKLATAMLSAGLMDKVASGLDLPTIAARSMPQNAVYNLTKATVDAGLATGISGKEFDQALQENLINAAFATLGNKIDLLDISQNNNTLLHAMLGSAHGTVKKDGWLAGTIESIISARLPAYMQKLRQKRLFREQLDLELTRQLQFNSTEAKQQEATLLQQAELKAKIINKLTLLARISAQEGRGFDLAQAMEQVNNKIDSMNLSELQDLEKFFIASADSRSVANPQIKQAVFDKPESLQQKGNQANLDKLLAIQSRQILEAAASGTSVGISEVELGAIQAIGSTAYKFINGLAELGVDLAKLLYKGAWHATKVDLLTNPEYEGALSDEARNRLSQEIKQNHDKLNSVLSKEKGKAIWNGLKNHYEAEFQGIKEKAAAGDICGMTKQATEIAIDAALMASAAGSAAKITAKLSKKAGKIAGATAKEVGNVAGDAAFNAVCAMAKKIRPDSTLTFKFDMELQKAQRSAAIANKEITGTGRPIISKNSSRVIKEANGEVPARIVMGEVGGVELPCRLPKNNGFDQVFVQRTAAGEVEKIFIIESKYNAKGKLHLSKTKNKGLQMSKPWIRETLAAMNKSGDSQLISTAELIKNNPDKLSFKANVLKPDGSNKWYSLIPTENGVIVNNIPTPKPK
jgi:hypothetical protein